jgi:hypothetical protein
MSRSTTAALLIGLAIGCVSTHALHGASEDRDAVTMALDGFKSAQASGFDEFQQSLQGPAKELVAALDAESKRYFASGDYERQKAARESRGRLASKSRCEAVVARRLAWCGVPGIYAAYGAEWANHQITLARDGTFTITPMLEAGSTGTWEWKEGAVVLKSERGWTKRLELEPQFVTKGITLRWHEDLAE